MAFGVRRAEAVDEVTGEKKIVKAITTETIVALAVVSAIFAVFAVRMGLANMFATTSY
jgi:hypothetical protein